jgi:hypothetical protein
MKNLEILPRGRINNLIDNLCKYAEIYENDRERFDSYVSRGKKNF